MEHGDNCQQFRDKQYAIVMNEEKVKKKLLRETSRGKRALFLFS